MYLTFALLYRRRVKVVQIYGKINTICFLATNLSLSSSIIFEEGNVWGDMLFVMMQVLAMLQTV